MKVKLVANELLDSSIEFISLVKNGAIRAPFKILKEESEMAKARNERREALLAKREQPRIVGSNFQQARLNAQRAADIGTQAVLKAGISGDTDVMDEQPNRYGADPLQANTSSERGTAENQAADLGRLREIISMLRTIGQDRTADAMEAFLNAIVAGRQLTKADEQVFDNVLLAARSAFRGGDLDWLEREGQGMQDRNRELISDRRLSSLDESISAKPRDAGIEKSDQDDVMNSALDSGLGVSGKYR